MASASQIKKIHTLKNILGLDNELYREILFAFKVESSKNLTYMQATDLIEVLEQKAVAKNIWQKKPLKQCLKNPKTSFMLSLP